MTMKGGHGIAAPFDLRSQWLAMTLVFFPSFIKPVLSGAEGRGQGSFSLWDFFASFRWFDKLTMSGRMVRNDNTLLEQ
jgi:hypothetical protein